MNRKLADFQPINGPPNYIDEEAKEPAPATTRDRNETIYRVLVEDIYLTCENGDRDESELTPEVVEKVIHKIEAMDFSDMAQTIEMFIKDAIDEIASQ